MDEIKGYYFSQDYEEKKKTKTYRKILEERALYHKEIVFEQPPEIYISEDCGIREGRTYLCFPFPHLRRSSLIQVHRVQINVQQLLFSSFTV